MSLRPTRLDRNERMVKKISKDVLKGYYDKIKTEIPAIAEAEMQKSREQAQAQTQNVQPKRKEVDIDI